MPKWPSYAALLLGSILLFAAGLLWAINQYVGAQSSRPDDLNQAISGQTGAAVFGLLLVGMTLLLGGILRFSLIRLGSFIILAGILALTVGSAMLLYPIWTGTGASFFTYVLSLCWILLFTGLVVLGRFLLQGLHKAPFDGEKGLVDNSKKTA